MNNMRRGFTMIELIFVIVIIGILAAVAIPKLAGTATQAKKSLYISFMGTLNRTVGPAMWADKVGTNNGSVKSITAADVLTYTELPDGLTLDLSKCSAPGTPPATAAGKIDHLVSGLKADEDIYCVDGTPTSAPRFGYAMDGNETNTSLQNN